jgi:hypothetical protein
MGFGRSGTSLLNGLLYHAGYFVGNHLHPARSSNPDGFYEDIIINRINEAILENYDFSKQNNDYPRYIKQHSPYDPGQGHRWLTFIKPGTNIDCKNESILERIREAVNTKQAFAFKDPRFNYTLPVWLPHLSKNTKFICVFRNPVSVAKSVVQECNAIPYLKDFFINEDLVYNLWFNSYSHFLSTTEDSIKKNTLFVSYENLVINKTTAAISNHLNTEIKNTFINQQLNRNTSHKEIPNHIKSLYLHLLTLTS